MALKRCVATVAPASTASTVASYVESVWPDGGDHAVLREHPYGFQSARQLRRERHHRARPRAASISLRTSAGSGSRSSAGSCAPQRRGEMNGPSKWTPARSPCSANSLSTPACWARSSEFAGDGRGDHGRGAVPPVGVDDREGLLGGARRRRTRRRRRARACRRSRGRSSARQIEGRPSLRVRSRRSCGLRRSAWPRPDAARQHHAGAGQTVRPPGRPDAADRLAGGRWGRSLRRARRGHRLETSAESRSQARSPAPRQPAASPRAAGTIVGSCWKVTRCPYGLAQRYEEGVAGLGQPAADDHRARVEKGEGGDEAVGEGVHRVRQTATARSSPDSTAAAASAAVAEASAARGGPGAAHRARRRRASPGSRAGRSRTGARPGVPRRGRSRPRCRGRPPRPGRRSRCAPAMPVPSAHEEEAVDAPAGADAGLRRARPYARRGRAPRGCRRAARVSSARSGTSRQPRFAAYTAVPVVSSRMPGTATPTADGFRAVAGRCRTRAGARRSRGCPRRRLRGRASRPVAPARLVEQAPVAVGRRGPPSSGCRPRRGR